MNQELGIKNQGKKRNLKIFHNSYFMIRDSGFTLIELLIVISIIGILAGIIAASVSSVRLRTRDGQRKSDMRQIQSALEFYRSDNGSYPLSGNSASNFPTTCGTSFTNLAGSTTYMQKTPCDPTNVSPYSYVYASAPSGCAGNSSNPCTTYVLTDCLENTSDSDVNDVTAISPCASPNKTYKLINP